MHKPAEKPTLELSEDHLVTLEAICDLFDATQPSPDSSMATQIAATRDVASRLRSAAASGAIGMIANYEIVKIEALTRVAHFTMNDPRAEQWRPQQAQFGLYPDPVNDLWIAISEIMSAFKKYGPDGDIGAN